MTKTAYLFKKKREIWWGLQVQSVKVHGLHGEEHRNRQAGMDLEQALKAYISIYVHETEKADWE